MSNILESMNDKSVSLLERYTERAQLQHKIKLTELYNEAAQLDMETAKEGKKLLDDFFNN